ncbi:MAG: polyprenyl synthetase family protein [Ruminococcaceae bacterium]|nr:polyprenyl synthetase family protein [Oscillospiraceae bacterium]
MDYQTRYAAYHAAIEAYLAGLFTQDKPYGKLFESMRYSILAGGKRIRPVLTLEFARLGGIDWHLALPYACALELVHNYSLIHDDLPCMDDDDLRRGKPTNHKVFGETMAVLAGDALQPEAFRLIAQAPELSAQSRIEAVEVLAKAAGADGMVGGQVLDTVCNVQDEENLTLLHRLKTGAMIAGAVELGCVAAEMDAQKRAQAVEYAAQLGLAFQIRDDMLDVVGDEEVFGKPIGSDREEGKVTFVDLRGLDGCARLVDECTARAKAAIADWPEHEFLFELADQMVGRTV